MNYQIGFLLILMTLTACQGQKEIVRETLVLPPTTTANPTTTVNSGANQSNMGGVDDGGGGNGIQGKPLESFRVHGLQIPEVSQSVLSILEKLKESSPLLANDMQYLLKERQWYFIPISLNEIPNFKLGTFFKTDQIAIQSRYEVWVDLTLYEKMDTPSKVKLIIHELMMGVRLLQFSNRLERCLVQANIAESESQLKANRGQCYKSFSAVTSVLEKPEAVSLDQDDYAIIRKATAVIFETKGDLPGSQLEAELAARKFRIY